jgi:hypothetical protein
MVDWSECVKTWSMSGAPTKCFQCSACNKWAHDG